MGEVERVKGDKWDRLDLTLAGEHTTQHADEVLGRPKSPFALFL